MRVLIRESSKLSDEISNNPLTERRSMIALPPHRDNMKANIKRRKTSRINVGHFMAELATDEVLWKKWEYQTPVIYNKQFGNMSRSNFK